ncbi:hypothetical protein [Effusibacillus consociatus]|uniref:Type II toxin-antitoxin system RelE/ParE family toxin n=1 Tax=Effusibacillus consociatus TaxID=1117041 RepID=A0ABV9PWI4_9BACL
MKGDEVIWPAPVLAKLRSYRNPRFTPEETYDFIAQFMIETEDLLVNPVVGKTYTEEYGKYVGFSRIVVRKFKIYYNRIHNHIVIVGVKFPGEQ